MRVLFLNPVGALGGAERSLLDLLAVLQKERDIELGLIACTSGPLVDEALALGVSASVVPMPAELARTGDYGLRQLGAVTALAHVFMQGMHALPSTFSYVRALKSKVDAFQPDILHSNGIKTHLLGALVRARETKLIWHIRDFLGQRPLVGKLLRPLSLRAHLGLANSNAVRDDARSTLRRIPIETLYNGIDTDLFCPARVDPSILDERAGRAPAPRDSIRIGIVATYSRWKGHDVFLRAAAELLKRVRRPLRFYIVGGPLYETPGSQFSRADLVAMAEEFGITEHVAFIPFQRNPQEIYQALDVVVHASTRPEPFGRTVVEAMACGRAVVVSKAGGAAELYTEGKDALGFPPGDEHALASSIERLLDTDSRERLSEAARPTAVRHFSRPRLAQELVRCYATIL